MHLILPQNSTYVSVKDIYTVIGGKWLKVLFLHCLLCCLANDYHKAGLSVGDEMNGNT